MTTTRPTRGAAPTDAAGWRRTAARVLGAGENPLLWSFPLGTLAGVRFRLHVLFPVYAGGELLASLVPSNVGWAYRAIGVACLLVLALLHDLARSLTRLGGGAMPESVVWPLGGLLPAEPGPGRASRALALAGGWGLHAALALGMALALATAGAPRAALVFNPLTPSVPLALLDSWALVTLWWAYYLNLVLLAFHALPVPVADAWRVYESVLERGLGRAVAGDVLTTLGMLAVLAIGVAALTIPDQGRLLAVAVVAGVSLWVEVGRRRFLEGAALPAPSDAGPESAIERRAAPDSGEEPALDHVLAKISRTGIDSLTARERRVLEEETRRRRGRADEP